MKRQIKIATENFVQAVLRIWYGIPLVCLALFAKLNGKMKRVSQSLNYHFAKVFAEMVTKFSRYYCMIEFLPKYADDVTECNLFTDTKNNEYAIVIQGPVLNEFTAESVRVYRKLYPKAVIIVSTWKGTNGKLMKELRGLADEVILSDPPKYTGVGNVNYQLKSSYEGMKRAYELGIPYAMKTRTDMRIYTPMLFEYMKSILEIFPVDKSVSQLQKERIIASSGGAISYAYWMGDFFYFGTTQDLMNFFDCPYDERNFKGKTTPEWGQYLYCSEKWRTLKKDKSRISNASQVYMAKSYVQRTMVAGDCESTVKNFWEDIRKRFFILGHGIDIKMYWDKYGAGYVNFGSIGGSPLNAGQPVSDEEFRFLIPLTFSLMRGHLLYEDRMETLQKQLIELFPSLGSFCSGLEHLEEVFKDLPLLKGDDQN